MATELTSQNALTPFIPFIEQLIAEGIYQSKEEVVAEGLRLLQDQERLRLEVKKGFDEIAAGKIHPADEVHARLDKLVDEIERRQNR